MSPQPSRQERILVRGVNWLGDAVMMTPALQRLRERFPQAEIRLLTHQKLADLWSNHPAVDGILSFASGESVWAVSRRLRGGGFNLALVFPNSPRSALESWLARIPRRVGRARPWRNWLLTEAVPVRAGSMLMHKRTVGEIKRLVHSPPRNTHHAPRSTPPSTAHHIHEYLHLVAAVGASPEPLPPRLVVTEAEVNAAAAEFEWGAHAEGSRPLFGLNAGAEYGPAKRWPLERFIAAAREIQRRTHCVWLLFGGAADLPGATAIRSALADANSAFLLAGRTSLRELMAALKLCRVLLTNDTGPMHVAAALEVPVVVPFGSTSPELTGPGLPGDNRHHLLQSNAPCAPCFRRSCPIDFRCMTGIPVDKIVEAVLQAAAIPQ